MSLEQQLFAFIISFVLFVATIQLVRTRKLREEYALLWLFASGVILFFSLAHGAIQAVGSLFDASYAPALVLGLGLMFAIGILLSHSVIITSVADQKRDLAQSIALLDWKVRELENRLDGTMALPNGHQNGNGAIEIGLVGEQSSEPPVAADEVQPGTGANQKPPRKVLVIGLDGATFDLIGPWAAEGSLPNLSRIIEKGAWGRMRSTMPPITGPAWTSFSTGTNPGKHGIYDWVARKDGSYAFIPNTALNCKVPTIYDLLSRAGRRVCAMNVPMTYPPTPVNGVIVSGLPAPSIKNTITYPPSLLTEMQDAVGEYILYPDPGQAYSDAGVESFLKRLYKTGTARIKAFDWLRAREAWDFTMLVFNGTDTVSHAMWKFMDRSHPLFDPSRFDRFGSAIKDYYRFCDDYLGKVIDQLDDDTTLIVMSDHGFGPFHKFIHVNNWLIQRGLMQIKPGVRSQLKAKLFRLGFSPMNVYDVMMRLGLGAFKREVVRGQGQGLLKTLFLSFDDIDWARTKAYSLGNIGQVNINVAGREPFGCVQPGAEYEQLRTEIMGQLMEISDPQTSERVVEAVYRREEIYQGDYLEKGADILFMPRRLEYFGFGEYEFGSSKVVEAMRRGISGTHRMDGIFMAYGRAIQPTQVSGAQIVDLAPTIMYLMGEAIPDHMDGRILLEAVRPELRVDEKTGTGGNWKGGSSDLDVSFTDEEAELLSERLRNLGYVG